jgi:hypothetical protein
MAARKKATKKRSTARKSASRRKAPARKKAAPKKRRAAARPVRSGKRRPAAKAKGAPTAEAIARKIIRATTDPSKLKIEDLYAEGCRSFEPSGPPAEGLTGIQGKMALWDQMQEGQKWKAVNIFIKKNAISIEWDAKITLRGGRTVPFREVAVHDLKGGKIINERYYYDPSQLAPPEEPAAPPPAQPPPPSSPPVNPLDL